MGATGKSVLSVLVAGSMCISSTAASAAASAAPTGSSGGCASLAGSVAATAQSSAVRPGCVVPQTGVAPAAVVPVSMPVAARPSFLGGFGLPALLALAAIVGAVFLLKDKDHNGNGSLSRA